MKTVSTSWATRSCFKWSIVPADPQVPGGEGRRHKGSNGHMHLVGHRDAVPGIKGRTRRDNVGKDHLPAGAGSNLQRPCAIRQTPKWAGRVLVWRMSPFERRRRGNARRERTGLAHDRGNAEVVQRGSGHLAVPEAPRTQCRDQRCLEDGTRPRVNRAREGCMRASALASSHAGRLAEESQGQNRTREIRLSGIAGGPGETWPTVNGHDSASAPKGAGHGPRPPTGARAPVLSRPLPGHRYRGTVIGERIRATRWPTLWRRIESAIAESSWQSPTNAASPATGNGGSARARLRSRARARPRRRRSQRWRPDNGAVSPPTGTVSGGTDPLLIFSLSHPHGPCHHFRVS